MSSERVDSIIHYGNSIKRGEDLAVQHAILDFGTTLSYFASDWGRAFDFKDTVDRFVDYQNEGLIGICGISAKSHQPFYVARYENDGKNNVGFFINVNGFIPPFIDLDAKATKKSVEDCASAMKDAVYMTESLFAQGAEFGSFWEFHAGIRHEVERLHK